MKIQYASSETLHNGNPPTDQMSPLILVALHIPYIVLIQSLCDYIASFLSFLKKLQPFSVRIKQKFYRPLL